MTKHKKIGGGTYGVYKKVFDWEVLFGWIFFIFVVLVLLGSCAA